MQLDFSILSTIRNNRGGQREYGGQPELIQVQVVPSPATSMGTLGTLQSERLTGLTEATMLSPLSPHEGNDRGHEKPSIDEVVPTAPLVPKEELLSPLIGTTRLNLLQIFRLFRFDLVDAEIAQGHPASVLDRINNMTWAFMLVKQMSFCEALQAASEVVVARGPALCEQEYINVRVIWQRLVNEVE